MNTNQTVDIDSIKPNSYTYKASQEEKERQELVSVVKGPVKEKKVSFGKRFANLFVSEDAGDVKSYIFFDVLIPALKDTIVDIITKSADMLFYGKVRSKGTYGGTYVSYNSFSNSPNRQQPREYARPRLTHEFDGLIFESRADAEDVLSTLGALIDQYQSASIMDLKDIAGLPKGPYTDKYYGWTNISTAVISHERGGGWSITMPRPIELR